MLRAFAYLAFAALQSGAAFSQSIEIPRTFEASDVHLSAPARNPFRRGPINRGGCYEVRNATMADLIAAAYGVDDDKVVGGPSWLEMDRFLTLIARTQRQYGARDTEDHAPGPSGRPPSQAGGPQRYQAPCRGIQVR